MEKDMSAVGILLEDFLEVINKIENFWFSIVKLPPVA